MKPTPKSIQMTAVGWAALLLSVSVVLAVRIALPLLHPDQLVPSQPPFRLLAVFGAAFAAGALVVARLHVPYVGFAAIFMLSASPLASFLFDLTLRAGKLPALMPTTLSLLTSATTALLPIFPTWCFPF